MVEEKLVCQEILQTVLEDPGLEVLQVTPQRDLKNLQGRGVRLDAECILGDGRHVDVEVQRSDNDDHQRRMRYNASCLTTNITDTGTAFRNIPDVIMVYISEFDMFKSGFTTYHIDRIVRETGKVSDNGLSEIYVNATVNDGSDIADLMSIFINDETYNSDKFPHTSMQKRYLKENPKGVNKMSSLIEKYFKEELLEARTEASAEGRAEGRVEGRAEGRLEILVGLVKDGLLSVGEAAKRLSMTENQFKTFL